MVASVASSRSTRSCVPIQPRSRALTIDSRYRPMLVGDVRWATTGCGSSWKLSGGSQWSSGPTNLSKNRHVRRAIRRSAMASAADSWRPADSARRLLTDRAIAGDSSQRPRTAGPAGWRPASGRGRERQRRPRSPRRRPSAGRSRPGSRSQAALRLRGGLPLEQVPARDEQARQGPRDRVRHERRLVGEERETQPDVGGGIGDVGARQPAGGCASRCHAVAAADRPGRAARQER